MGCFEGKKVIIPGGAGFIGSNLAIRLVNEGAKVTIIDNFLPDLGGNPFNLHEISGKFELVRFDLCQDESALDSTLEGADFIFSMAGNISHKDSMDNPIFDLRSNLIGHINLLEGIRKFCRNAVVVNSSTRQIYGAPQYSPVDEKHPISPVDVNGINKYAAEQYYSLYHRVHGLKIVNLRLTNTYGPRQLIRHARQGFIGWFVNRAVSGNSIELFGGGEQLRDLTEITDAVEALCLAATNPECIGKIFNLSGFTTSLRDIATTLISESGRGSIHNVPFPADRKRIDIGNYEANSSLFYEKTGWKPTVPVREGLCKMVHFYEENWEHYTSLKAQSEPQKQVGKYEQHPRSLL